MAGRCNVARLLTARRALVVLALEAAGGLGVACTGQVGSSNGGRSTGGGAPMAPVRPGAKSPGLPPGEGTPEALPPPPPPTPQDTDLAKRFFPAAPAAPSSARLWLLTREQYNRTVQALLADASLRPADAFSEDVATQGFAGQAAQGGLDDRRVGQVEAAAVTLSALVIERLDRFVGCKPASADNEPCVRDFLRSFGKRAFRRPLTDAEVERYAGHYAKARTATGSGAGGLKLVVEGMLRSPFFLFRSEVGTGPGTDSVVKLTPHEVAASLSYALTNGPPDEELEASADSGAILSVDERRRQATRLLATAAGALAWNGFVKQWLGMSDIAKLERDPAYYAVDDTFRSALAEEVRSFTAHVLTEAEGDFKVLMTAPYAYLLRPLGAIYGIPASMTLPASGAAQKVMLDPRQRGGILTQAAFLASHANTNETSVTDRGVFIASRLACVQPPPPPPGQDTTLPSATGAFKTKRQRFEKHAIDPVCAACHTLFDPLGYALEHYDAVGRYRATENSVPIDASGTLSMLTDPRPFQDAVELAQLLAEAPDVHQCLVRQLFRATSGRQESEGDHALLSQMFLSFRSSGLDVRQIVAAWVTHPSFVERRAAL